MSKPSLFFVALYLLVVAQPGPAQLPTLSDSSENRQSQEYQLPSPSEQQNNVVNSLSITPGNVTLPLDENVIFTAVTTNSKGARSASGDVKWQAQAIDGPEKARISHRGEFLAQFPGRFKISAEAGGHVAEVTVAVLKGQRHKRRILLARVGKVSSRYSADDEPLHQKVTARLNKAKPIWSKANIHTAFDPSNRRGLDPVYSSETARLFLKVHRNDPSNISLLPRFSTIGNRAGEVPGGTIGDKNFGLTAPVVRLPGRGLDIVLQLTYNSQVWQKNGNLMVFDIDHDWPAPGWSLGFGKLVKVGSGTATMLVDANGARHPFGGTEKLFDSYGSFKGHTTDGLLIDYFNMTETNGSLTVGQAKYPNGTVVEFTAGDDPSVSRTIYPTRITDANGNYITITYRHNRGPEIDTVTDTLGRTINFYYDTDNLLTAITAPTLYGNGKRTLVRLHYKKLTVSTDFNKCDVSLPECQGGILAEINDTTPYVIDAIYYPATSTGYWFGDPSSFSVYGMLSKVMEQRTMGFAAASLEEQGIVTAGTMTRQHVYDYPVQPDSTLTDAPSYSKMTETWDGMDTAPVVTHYKVDQNANPRRAEVIFPDGSRQVQLSDNAPHKFNDGLLKETYIYDAGGTLLQRSVITWELGDYDSPRIAKASVADERGRVTRTEFSYGVHNQQSEILEYGAMGGGPPLRRTHIYYKTDPGYASQHIFNLPNIRQVYEGSEAVPAAQVEYDYDNYSLADTPGVTAHLEAFNPYASRAWVPRQCHQECEDSQAGHASHCSKVCEGGYWETAFDPLTDYRGNITQVKTYADAAHHTGAIAENRRYDIDGNLIAVVSPCCEQTTFAYALATEYAYPTTQTRGSIDPNSLVRVNTAASYDYYTGLLLSTTDASGNTIQMIYAPTTLRLESVYAPTLASTTYEYDDSALSITATTRDSSLVQVASQTIKYFNGRGLIRREGVLADSGVVNLLETKYDLMGRVWKESRPFRSGQVPIWSETFYDALGRLTRTRAADGSEVRKFYNESVPPNGVSGGWGQTVRIVDPWSRERWIRTDELGRLAEVLEPNPIGTGSFSATGNLSTMYYYNVLGNLVDVSQSSQSRHFVYDSMGRLTHQRLIEKDATLNAAGTYVGIGGEFSDVFIYDGRSNVVSHTDARGIKTIYDYANDPLNRLQTVTYDTSGFGDTQNPVLPASSISYQYLDTGDQTQLKMIASDISAEDYGYDAQGRLSSKTLTISDSPGYPLETDYFYDDFNRLTDAEYPAAYGMPDAPREPVHYEYSGPQLKGITVNDATHLSDIEYNVANEMSSMKVGGIGPHQITEMYDYDGITGLLNRQQVLRAGIPLLDLSYGYQRPGTIGRTGQLTAIADNLDAQRNRAFNFDALGRLAKATGGSSNLPLWNQIYSYDRFGNRTSVSSSGTSADGTVIPRDGFPATSYGEYSNRITTNGFAYDAAGDQTRALRPDGTWQRYQYDAAGRLAKVNDDAGATLETYAYGGTRQRLRTMHGLSSTYYVWNGDQVIAEYSSSPGTHPEGVFSYNEGVSSYNEGVSSYNEEVISHDEEVHHLVNVALVWNRSYVYLSEKRLLSTLTPGTTGEVVDYHHPDRLGARLETHEADTKVSEQVTLPFGVPLDAESNATIQRFTSYDRSPATGLDYAVNRVYDSQQGRLIQVDPLGIGAVNLADPQTLNLYAYVNNDPLNTMDPTGLGCEVKQFSSHCTNGVELNVPVDKFRADVNDARPDIQGMIWMVNGWFAATPGGKAALALFPEAGWLAGRWGQAVNQALDNIVANAAANPANAESSDAGFIFPLAERYTEDTSDWVAYPDAFIPGPYSGPATDSNFDWSFGLDYWMGGGGAGGSGGVSGGGGGSICNDAACEEED